MKVYELITILFLVFAGYSVIKDVVTPKPLPTCYHQIVLQNGDVVGNWSVDNCELIK